MEWLMQIQEHFQNYLNDNNVSSGVAAAIASCLMWVIFIVWKLGKTVFGSKVMSETADLLMQSLKNNDEWRWGEKNGKKTGNSIVFDRGDCRIVADYKKKAYSVLEKNKNDKFVEKDLTNMLTKSERKALNKSVVKVKKHLEEKELGRKMAKGYQNKIKLNNSLAEMLEEKQIVKNKPVEKSQVANKPSEAEYNEILKNFHKYLTKNAAEQETGKKTVDDLLGKNANA